MIVLILLLVLLIAAGIGTYFILKNNDTEGDEGDEGDEEAAGAAGGETETNLEGLQNAIGTPPPLDPADAPVDCVGEWTAWSDCSQACGVGVKKRTYNYTTPAKNGGRECTDGGEPVANGQEQPESCNTHPCPVDCVGTWTEWTPCTKPCGSGETTRTYTHKILAKDNGKNCPHQNQYVAREACNTQPCAVDCQGAWSPWTDCSRNEQGYQYKKYTISVFADHGGSTTTCEASNNYTVGQFCNDGNELWQSAADNGTGANAITGVTIPGPTGADAIPGSLEFMGKWYHYGRACGPLSNRDCETGLAMFINDEHRATMHRWASGGGNYTTAWKRISGVKSGDTIKASETGDRTQNAKLGWKFHPNDTGAHPRTEYDIRP